MGDLRTNGRARWRSRAADLPTPDATRIHVGDGDFRAIGEEFVNHLIDYAGLGPDDRVLDVGCGIGRIAIPLTQYLGPAGRYLGFDVVADAIAWCREHVAPLHAGFRFETLDVRHPLYNPSGARAASETRWPAGDASVDVVLIASVFTHLTETEAAWFLAETARVLKPGGHCLSSWFLTEGDRVSEATDYRLRFAAGTDAFLYNAGPGEPTAAVAVPLAWVRDRLAGTSLRLSRHVRGRWSGSAGGAYQDLLVLRKASARLPGAGERR